MPMIPNRQRMNYRSIEDLKEYGMFVAACLSDNQLKDLRAAWERAGGHRVIPWWKYVLEHTKVSLDFSSHT